ncbi:MAG: site-specific integrase [Oscillospiraceae bacterium]|nr:site-specific integrase [Oscillospiraceae bacterium]
MTKDTGIYKKDNGVWEYRFTLTIDGKKITKKGTTDENGNKLKTKAAAAKAREQAIAEAKYIRTEKPKIIRKTFEEVYNEYAETGRKGKAKTTIRKQESLWNNHLQKEFGGRFVDEIAVAEVNDYLSRLYYDENRAYKYVESFLKMFYLIFGQAYSRNYLNVDTYNKLCTNKNTKIHMPKVKDEDDGDIVAFSKKELKKLDNYFIGSNAETAYYLGRYFGLRINEAYGVKWENIDLEKGTITIDRQMAYHEGLIYLAPVKTKNGKRTVYMNKKMKLYFTALKEQLEQNEITLKEQRKQNAKLIKDIDGKIISSTELLNTLPNGKIQTVNSMKYHSRTLKADYKIDFKFHYLRHTYGTVMAELNTPAHILCNQMGHAKIQTTQMYYLAITDRGVKILQDNLNRL